MTYPISDVTRRVVYSGSAGTGPYSFSFEILTESDIGVYKNTTLLTITTDYSVTINADGTGSVTLISAAASTDTISIFGNKGIQRQTDFTTGGDLFANSLNDELDAQTIFAQQNSEALLRSLRAPVTDPTTIDMVLPAKADRANKVLSFDASGDPVVAQELGTYQGTDATTTTAAYNVRDIVKSTTSAQQNNIYICIQASPAGTLLTNTSYWALIVDAVSAATFATNAASSATAAAASETAAAASETAAAASESAAGTSETNAASSASAASTSAAAAAASQTAAAASAASAANSYDAFDDRYLGVKTADPTLDNDGNALVAGALYFNSTANEMRVYDGGNWIAASSAGGASLYNYNYTATASQTTFSGADDNANTLSYTVDNLIVTLNGVVLEGGTDYTATNGTSVVLTSGAASGDELNIVAFKSFTTADMVSATNGGTFYGNVDFGAGIDVTGTVAATAFTGDGSALTGISTISDKIEEGNSSVEVVDTGTGHVAVTVDGSETARFDANGRLGIGTSSPNYLLQVDAGTGDGSRLSINNEEVGLFFAVNGTGTTNGREAVLNVTRVDAGTYPSLRLGGQGAIIFAVDANNERARIDSSGNLLVGKTASAVATAGHRFSPTGLFYHTRASNSLGGFNRTGNDGVIVNFYQNGTTEGTISVSGTTVSYNGGHLARWSRLTDDSKDTSIVKGTVMTNLDAMVEWGDEENEQLNKMAVSSIEGDSNVAGVFVNWDNDDDWNDMNIAMTGDMVIRIAQNTTVARGDLLMSAGDGTAKPQGDDIVRSKTIAKVTSTHVSHTYADGSYCVPCVLMAC